MSSMSYHFDRDCDIMTGNGTECSCGKSKSGHVQTRDGAGATPTWNTISEAFEQAEEDPSIWKISWTDATTGERVRLVRTDQYGTPLWVYDPIIIPKPSTEGAKQVEETVKETTETTTETVPAHEVRREEKRTTEEPKVVEETTKVTETVESD